MQQLPWNHLNCLSDAVAVCLACVYRPPELEHCVRAHVTSVFAPKFPRPGCTASYICLNDLLYHELIIDSLTVPVSHRFSPLVSPASQCENVTMSHTDFSLFPLASVSVTVSPGIFFLFSVFISFYLALMEYVFNM